MSEQETGRPPSRLKRAVAVLTYVMVALVGVSAPFLWAQKHPLLPGERGCSYVRDGDARRECLARQWMPIMASSASARDRLLRGLDERSLTNPRFTNDCHLAMHDVAEWYVNRDKGDPMRLYSKRIPKGQCSEGIDHGLLIATYKSDLATHTRIRTLLCDRTASSQRRISCYHGLGHAFVRVDKSIGVAVGKCHRLEKARGAQAGCLDGAYMEHGMSITEKDPRKAFAQVCRNAEPRDLIACFGIAPIVFLENDRLQRVEQSLALCASLRDNLAAAGCLSGIDVAFKLSSLGLCLKYRGDALRARCATHVVARAQSRGDSTTKVQKACLGYDDPGMRFGCGAGLMGVLFPKGGGRTGAVSGPPDVGPARQRCASLRAAFREGCLVGALRCWPNEVASVVFASPESRVACSRPGLVPDSMLLRIGGEVVPNVYSDGFDRWYQALDRRVGGLPRGA